jgi:hypothetical protein
MSLWRHYHGIFLQRLRNVNKTSDRTVAAVPSRPIFDTSHLEMRAVMQ